MRSDIGIDPAIDNRIKCPEVKFYAQWIALLIERTLVSDLGGASPSLSAFQQRDRLTIISEMEHEQDPLLRQHDRRTL